MAERGYRKMERGDVHGLEQFERHAGARRSAVTSVPCEYDVVKKRPVS
jgi:hypothetical protein